MSVTDYYISGIRNTTESSCGFVCIFECLCISACQFKKILGNQNKFYLINLIIVIHTEIITFPQLQQHVANHKHKQLHHF